MDSCVKFLPDYANNQHNGRSLHRVGISGVDVKMIDFTDSSVVTSSSAYVNLSSSNGIHMSRLVGILLDLEGMIIDPRDDILHSIEESHECTSCLYSCRWDAMEYIESFDQSHIRFSNQLEGVKTKDDISWYWTFVFPYASVCPCSAEMTKIYDGIPHMQRALATITGQIEDDFPADILDEVAKTVSLIPMPWMKREDELKWCQEAKKVNLFVEDAARNIGDVVDKFFPDWVVVCEHQESIHQHNVVAVARKGDKLA
jgi:GTP cyclohydrolase FolE2